MKLIYVFSIVSILFLGCASTAGNLQRATATNIGKNTLSSDVAVKDIKRKATNVSWYAVSKEGTCYRCEADDMVRQVNCVEVSCQ